CGLRLTAVTTCCDPASRIEPCCRNALPFRTCAEPTSLRPATSTSPPTGVAKQDAGWSRILEDGGGRWGASVASTPRDRSAAARLWPAGSSSRSHSRRCSGSSRRVRLDRRTDADQVPVAAGAVHAARRRPYFVRPRRDGGERGALARVGAVPRIGGDGFQRVRRVRQQVVAAGLRPVLDVADLLADRDQRVAEAVQLLLRLALGGLDHQGA